MQLSRLRPLNLSSFIFYHKYEGVCVFLFVRFVFGSKHCTRWNTIQPNLWQAIFSLRTLLELTFSLACFNPPQADLLLHEEDSRQTQAEEFEVMEIDRQFEKGNTDDESEDEDMDIT